MSGSEIKRVKTLRGKGSLAAGVVPLPAGSSTASAPSGEQDAGLDDQTTLAESQSRTPKYSSFLRPVEDYIDGWIIDQQSPDEIVTVTVFIDDEEIATTRAHLERTHLKKKFGISSSEHGFRVLVPDRFRDGNPHVVSLAVPGSSHRREAREELQIPQSDSAPSLEILAISEGYLAGRLYGARDGDVDAPELWVGASQLGADDVALEWGANDSAIRSFRIDLRSCSAEDLLIRSAEISVAHGKASGHGLALSSFIAPGIARVSSDEIAVGAAIPCPVLDQARCRLELSLNETFSASAYNFPVDLSLGINDIVLPVELRNGAFWARILLLGASSPIELLAPTRVPEFSAVSGSVTTAVAAVADFGPVYVYNPGKAAAGSQGSEPIDASIRLASSETDTPQARLVIATDDSGPGAFLRLATGDAHGQTRLRFVFSGSGLQAGDILHLRWFGRSAAEGTPGEARKQIALSISVDGANAGEAWTDLVPARSQWRDHHAIILTPTVAQEVAVEFAAPAGCLLDFGGLAVGKIANAAGSLPQTVGDAAGLALDGVFTYPLERLPSTAELSNYRRFGLVAKLDSDSISGIAWGHENVRRSTQLQLLVDGQFAGIASAEPLGNFGKGASPGLFTAALPSAARDGLPHEIDVQFMGTRESLIGAPQTLAVNSRHDGVAWITPEGVISGWAADLDEDAGPIEVEIRADNRPVGRMIANAQHPMFSDPAHNSGRCAFDFAIPPSLRDGRLHTITVRTSAGVELSGSPILAKLTKGQSTLHIDPSLSGWIKGWIIPLVPPASASILEVAINGEFFGTIRAEPSHDGGAGGRGTRFRFSFRLPSHAAKVRLSSTELGVEVELDVVRVGDGGTLQPSKEIVPAVEGLYAKAKTALLAAPAQHVDADWYFAMYSIAAKETENGRRQSAAEHWLTVGAKRGWSPNPWFNERWYLACNPDAAAAVEAGEAEAGYLHWLAIGAYEWRTPGVIFNPVEYRRAHPLAEDSAVEETAFDVVREWMTELARREREGTFETESHQEAAPSDPDRSLFRRIVTSRWDKSSMFDTHVGRLLEDLRIAGHSEAAHLRRAFDDNEVEIIRDAVNYDGLDEPLVSIIMPTFNRAYVIAEGIQSVIDQSWQNWELIVCDDGSFDKTAKVVQQFGDPRIRYLPLEKSNGAIARNFGIRFSRGEYITFLDSDNIWHPLFLSMTINKMRSSLRPVAYTGYIDTSSNAARYTEAVLKFAPFDYLSLIARNYIDLNSLVVRRDLLNALGSFDETLPRVQDWDLALRLLRYFDPIEVRCAVVFYRRNPSWGQVTDLAAHTDYTKVVRQRALDRLGGRAAANTSLPLQTVSLYAGVTSEMLETSLAFTRLLSDVADVQLLLQDAPAQHSALAEFEIPGRVRLVWLRGQDRLSDHLGGRALFVPEHCQGAELEGVPAGFPVAEFVLVRDRLIVKDRRLKDDLGITLGALRPDLADDDENFLEFENITQETRNSAAVLTVASMRQRWTRALARRIGKLQATLVWYDGDQLQMIEFNNSEGKIEVRSFRDELKTIGRHAVVLLGSGSSEERLKSVSFGIEAFRKRAVLAVGADPLYEEWVTGKYAHLAPDDPEAASEFLIKVLNDHSGSQRMRTRSRRLFDYLYRSEAVKTRLNIAISLL